MSLLLDSNVCIALMRGKKPHVTARFQAHSPADLYVCSVVVGELCAGAARSKSPAIEQIKVDAFLAPYWSLPFDDPAARKYAELRAVLEATGNVVHDLDLMIAAITLVHGLTVVTHNTRDFSRIPGVSPVDWEIP